MLLPAMVHSGIILKNPVDHSLGAPCSVRDGLLNIMLQQVEGVFPNLSQLWSPHVHPCKGQCLGGNNVGMAGAPLLCTVKVQAAPSATGPVCPSYITSVLVYGLPGSVGPLTTL